MEGAVRQYGSILAGGDAVFLSGPCLLLQTISLSVKKGTLISTKTYVTDIRCMYNRHGYAATQHPAGSADIAWRLRAV